MDGLWSEIYGTIWGSVVGIVGFGLCPRQSPLWSAPRGVALRCLRRVDVDQGVFEAGPGDASIPLGHVQRRSGVVMSVTPGNEPCRASCAAGESIRPEG
jgi:hypothetical protein